MLSYSVSKLHWQSNAHLSACHPSMLPKTPEEVVEPHANCQEQFQCLVKHDLPPELQQERH